MAGESGPERREFAREGWENDQEYGWTAGEDILARGGRTGLEGELGRGEEELFDLSSVGDELRMLEEGVAEKDCSKGFGSRPKSLRFERGTGLVDFAMTLLGR